MRTIYPQAGFVEADLVALLATGQFVYAECFTVTPLVGPVMRYTSYQRDVTVVPVGEVSAQTYKASEVQIAGLRTKTGIGVEVDEQNVTLSYGSGLLWQGILTYPRALLLGRMDGASIRRDRYFRADTTSPWIAGVPMFSGQSSSCTTVGRLTGTVNVKSDLVLLNVDMPRDLFIPQCKNTWGDPTCGVNQSAFDVPGVTLSGTTKSVLVATGYNDTFSMGKVHIIGSDTVTRVRTILRATTSQIELIYPLDFLPALGTNFTAYPTCRRLYENCGDYHVNPEQKFIGFPFVPVAETAA